MNKTLKSVLALALAIPAVSVIAQARDYNDRTYSYNDVYEPGTRVLLYYDDFYRDGSSDGDLLPSEVELSSEYFSISTKTFSKGSNLVKSIAIDDDEEAVAITLIDNYMKEAPSDGKTSITISKLAVKAKKSIKDGSEYILSKGKTYEFYDPTYDTNKLYLRIGYVLEEYECNRDGQDITVTEDDSLLVKWTGGDSYGIAQVYYDDYAYAEGRVYKSDTVLYSFNTELDSTVYKKYPEADLECVNILGTFPSKMTFYLYADEDEYVYRYDNGKISTSGLKWSDDDAAWVGNITQGYCYIISDTKLKTTSSSSSSSSTSRPSSSNSNWTIVDEDDDYSSNNNYVINVPSNNTSTYYPSTSTGSTYYPSTSTGSSSSSSTIYYPSYPTYFNPETGGGD